jgi:4-hydroxybenzoate polyprenyltransferase
VKLSVWLRLGRVSNLPTVWSNVLAGVVLAGAEPSVPAVLGLCAAFSSFYVGGMFLNDAFDAAIDAEERPERPIPSGQVAARSVFLAGFAALALSTAGLVGLALLLGGSPLAAGAAGAVLAALIVFYDAYHKHNPLSPLVMGLCRVGVYVGAALAVAPGFAPRVVWAALALLGYLIGLTYAAKQESLNRLRAVWPLAFLSAPLVHGLATSEPDPALLGVALALLLWQLNALKLLQPGPRRSVPMAVVRLIAGIALVDALVIVSLGVVEAAIVAFALWGLTRLFQLVVPGT